MEYCNKKEYGLELELEQEHLNSEDKGNISNKNSQMDKFDVAELSEELGEMEFKNFLYKR
ncbi:MAG: hypothetical protein A2889_06145 [Nitrospinae bacterium RIFCSPLOWO2_01_FULL_39_10]|nr:MAG: hypothetical protein A2889_06145 [Nitrospinae bacterium RIFCSPLOWO2_01_FULL_39_10]